MHVVLSTEEAAMLKGLLTDCIPDLQREIARTENRGFRHELVEREELCERLIARLAAEGWRTASSPAL